MGKDKRKVSFVGKYPAETITMVYPSRIIRTGMEKLRWSRILSGMLINVWLIL